MSRTADPASSAGAARPRLLLVDDEPDVRAAMRRVLERAGFEVRLASSAADALEALAAEPADVVITDIIMPRQNGAELIAVLRKNFPKTRIIAISGGGNFWPQGYKPDAITTTAYLAAAERAGAHGILAKPFEMLELIDAVRGVLTLQVEGN